MKSYQDLLSSILLHGENHEDRTGVGTVSLFGYQWRHRMIAGFPLLTTKKLPLRIIAEELFWFLSGSTDVTKLQEKKVAIWDEWATAEQCAKFGRQPGDLGPVYGELWRSFPVAHRKTCDDQSRYEIALYESVDQIADLMDDLKKSPNSRRLIVTGWHPYWQRKVTLPPCHTLFQCKVHPKVTRRVYKSSHSEDETGEGLSLHLYARSIDSFLGLPFNIASHGLLLSLLAHVTGRIPWDLIISFGDVHIYRNHEQQVNEQLGREPKSLPYIVIDERLKDRGLDGLLTANWEDIKLYQYDPHPAISAPVAV